MSELRLIGKSADGTHLNLADGDNSEFSLRISDNLRATVNQPRLSSVPAQEDETVSVREIQARLRSGEPMENIARDAHCDVDKIERFAGPILQERTYIIGLAQAIVMRKEAGRDPVTFEEVVISRLAPRQVDMNALEWNTWRLEDGTWIIRILYPTRDGVGSADWSFDLTRRALQPLDDGAHWMVGEEVPPSRTVDHGLVYGTHPSATRQSQSAVTHDVPRLISIRPDSQPAPLEDGIKVRAKVPSWDEIMFGVSKKKDADPQD